MEANFWHQKWEKSEIGFHRNETNPFLLAHFEKLNLAKGSRVFLPLCGKTRDFAWLLANGYRVAGVELSTIAIQSLFEDLGVEPTISRLDNLTHYSAENIDIYVGDIFNLSTELIGIVDGVYDRAALVALPNGMRDAYTSHLLKLTKAPPQLLVTYEYDQRLVNGPPFSISEDEVKRHYAAIYELQLVEHKDVVGGLRQKAASTETAWLLKIG